MAAEYDEGLLSANRISELEEDPVKGRFDAAHLKEIHRRIFQDMPGHAPGEYRPAASGHMKARSLEESGHRYYVHYAPRSEIDTGVDKTLAELGGPAALRGLNAEQFSARMAQLYGDLDYLHPFKEGNSRTLRAFTSQLANEAGHKLVWGAACADPASRDRLYIARDKEVTQRAFPGLDEERAMATDRREEYEAYALISAPFRNEETLQGIIKRAAFNDRDLDAAQAFREQPGQETFELYPDLAGSYTKLVAIVLKAEADGLNAQERQVVASRSREALAMQIERGLRPDQAIREQQDVNNVEPDFDR